MLEPGLFRDVESHHIITVRAYQVFFFRGIGQSHLFCFLRVWAVCTTNNQSPSARRAFQSNPNPIFTAQTYMTSACVTARLRIAVYIYIFIRTTLKPSL